METTIYVVVIAIMEKNMETTVQVIYIYRHMKRGSRNPC